MKTLEYTVNAAGTVNITVAAVIVVMLAALLLLLWSINVSLRKIYTAVNTKMSVCTRCGRDLSDDDVDVTDEETEEEKEEDEECDEDEEDDDIDGDAQDSPSMGVDTDKKDN